jgi:hypothetical protein
MMEIADPDPCVTCPDCEERRFELDMVDCTVCGKSACKDCLTLCGCGCEKWVHRDCAVIWETNRLGEHFRWRKTCLLDHAEKLEAEAKENIEEAARARRLAA